MRICGSPNSVTRGLLKVREITGPVEYIVATEKHFALGISCYIALINVSLQTFDNNIFPQFG